MDANRIPVIIGVGQVNDREATDADALNSSGLMLAALTEAERDAGAPVINRLDWLGVEDQISFPDDAIHERLASMLPRRPVAVVKTQDASGNGPTELINQAANLIGSGEVRLAATVGGEALRTAARWAKSGNSRAPLGSDRIRVLSEQLTSPLARRYGLATPTEVYPLYEHATRAAWRQSFAEAQQESGTIWASMSRVAAANPAAWLRKTFDSAEIVVPSATNRMISFPYTKLMVANSSVNQGAAVLVSSLALARELGVPEARLVYVGAGAGAHESTDYLRRDTFDHSASLEAVIAGALEANALSADRIDLVELYSCFPCIPKMARRALGWHLDRPTSVYGGLTFGGGPIGNCMMHAAAAMVSHLRERNGTGLIVANGGFATHNHAIVLTREAPRRALFPQDYSVQTQADARRRSIPPLLDSYRGAGTIETYAIPYGADGAPRYAAIIARTATGARFLAHVPPDDTFAINRLTMGAVEPVGLPGVAAAMDDGRSRWTFDALRASPQDFHSGSHANDQET